MAVCVIGLEYALTPASESMLERHNHAVVIRYSGGGQLGHSAKPRIGARRNRGTCAFHGWQRAKAKCIRRLIQYQLMETVIPEVANAHRRGGAEGLLHFEAPFLILGRLEYTIRTAEGWWRKTANLGDFREAFSRRETAQELRIRIRRVLEEARRLIRGDVVFLNGKVVGEWWVGKNKKRRKAGQRIIEDANSAAKHRVV